MKKLFVSKSVMKKIALALVFMILFQVVVSRPVEASGLGGTLLSPIVNLVVYLADGAISILQNSLTTAGEPFNYIDLSGNKATLWGAIWTCVIGVVFVGVAIAATVLSAGTALAPIVAIVAPAAASIGLTGAVGSVVVLCFYEKVGETLKAVVFGNSFVYSNIFITPETLLKDQIAIFNVNFFQDVTGMESDATYDLAITIRGIVQGIYRTLRDISIMAMLIVVVYIAIKMLISLSPREKNRYRESFANCIVGLLLIIFMHFIMSITTSSISMITKGIVGENVIYECDDPENFDPATVVNDEELRKKYTVGGALQIEGEELYDAVTENGEVKQEFGKIAISGEQEVMVSAANFLELSRYKLQQIYNVDESGENKQTNWTHIGWAFVYIMLVILTIAFTWMYAKRFLYMVGLTIFAPIVGLMYPINKADGSRAQTLNLWLREYIGNLVIQPFHMLLYTILIGGAIAVALDNPVYVIIALMGMTFIEKLLKDLVGIQDTRIGGLGNALSETNKALKTGTRAMRDLGRSARRTIDGAARGAVGLTGKVASAAKAGKDKQGTGDESADGENAQPRTQQPPPAAPAANQGLPSADEENLQSGSALEYDPDELDPAEESQLIARTGKTLEQLRAEAQRNPLDEELDPAEEAQLIARTGKTLEQLRAETQRNLQIEGGLDENGIPIADESAYKIGIENKKEAEMANMTGDFGTYSLGGGDLGETGSNLNMPVQPPSFINPETASQVAQERMAELEGKEGKRFATTSGIEAVTDGSRIVADFTSISKEKNTDPSAAMAKEIPFEIAVGQDFMPDMNQEMKVNPTLKIGTPTSSVGSASSVDTIGGASVEGFSDGGSVSRVGATGRQGPIEYNPEIVNDSAPVIPSEGRRTIEFKPANLTSEEPPVSVAVGDDKSIPSSHRGVIQPEHIQSGSSIVMTENKGATVEHDVTYTTTGFENVSGAEHVTSSGIAEHKGSTTAAFETEPGVKDVTYATTGLKNVSGAEHVTSSGIGDNTHYTNDIPTVSVDPDALKQVSAKRTNTQVNMGENDTITRGKGRIDFVPPQVGDEAPVIPADRRKTIQFDPNPISSNRISRVEGTHVEPEQPTRENRRIQFTNSSQSITTGSGGIVSDAGSTGTRVQPVHSTPPERRVNNIAERPAERPTERSTERPAERPQERPQERVQERVQEEPQERATERSAERPKDRERKIEVIADGLSTAGKIAGTVTGGATKTVGDLIEGVISMAADGATGNVGAVKDTAQAIVTGTMQNGAAVADTVGNSLGHRGVGQISDDANYIKREGITEEYAKMADQYCKAHKIDDKHNKALVARLYQETGEKDKDALTKLSAQIIKAKKDGREKKDVEAYLDRQKISHKTKKALLDLFDKAHR